MAASRLDRIETTKADRGYRPGHRFSHPGRYLLPYPPPDPSRMEVEHEAEQKTQDQGTGDEEEGCRNRA